MVHEKRTGLRDARYSRRATAGSHDRRGDDTDLRHVDLRAGKPRETQRYDYARSINPTRLAYEKCIADLESGSRGFAFASGLSAMATVLELLDSGSHVVASDDLYGGTFRLFDRVRRRSANLDFTYVDLTDAKDLEGAIKPNTRMVWIETPSNPLLKLIDLEAIAKIARKRKLISVSDNTFATRGSSDRLNRGSISLCIPQRNI
jgi:cystathionine gamma-lyase